MSRPTSVDREKELALFSNMIAGKTDERIFLIQAASGMGKTTLLNEFRKRCPNKTVFALIDFKGGGVSLPELFSRLCIKVDRIRFAKFATAVKEFIGQPAINILDNTILEGSHIEVALHAPDNETREFRRVALTDAFFEDLHQAGKVILVFDTFNDCDPFVQAWLSSAFLARIERVSNVIVIVAGQNIPPISSEWNHICCYHTLDKMACEHWHTYAKHIGANIKPDWIDAFFDLLKGHPDAMAKTLNGYIPQGER